MKRLLLAIAILSACLHPGSAQTLDDLNIQLHGYATQAVLYSDHNSWNTTGSEHASFSWNEAVVNLSAQPESRLHIAVQARYFLLGDLGNAITLDFAQADYKVNERFGIRVGKVKTPLGLFNESQDIDPAQIWVMLPQSVYPLSSRNFFLAHYGGVAYGSIPMASRLGKLEYRGFLGQRTVPSGDGYFLGFTAEGISVPNGITGKTFGGTLRWITPLRGLMLGASEAAGCVAGELSAGPYVGSLTLKQCRQTYYFAQFEHRRWMLDAEFNRLQATADVAFPGLPDTGYGIDRRPWYVMASYKFTDKFSAGSYYGNVVDHDQPAGQSASYQHDLALTGRYDVSPYLYLKLEQHFMQGTLVGFSPTDDPNPQPNTTLSLLKLGVSF